VACNIGEQLRYLQYLSFMAACRFLLLPLLLLLIALVGCKHKDGARRKAESSDTAFTLTLDADTITEAASASRKKTVQYTPQQLESFFDSVGRQDPSKWIEESTFLADSLFNSPEPVDQQLSPADFVILKKACLKGALDIATAKRIFEITDTVLLKQDSLSLTFLSFDKKKTAFQQFAVSAEPLTSCYGCALYFFKGDRIISKHTLYNHYGVEVNHFRDALEKTIVYYKTNFERGSGIWWFNYFFYQYDGDTIRPVLNELENANLQPFWSVRSIWLEAFILKTRPLTLKMVYHIDLPDSTGSNVIPLLNDSTIVTYSWDEYSKLFRGNYSRSKITKPQILSYYLLEHEMLFMNVYHKRLRHLLKGSGVERDAVLVYLNNVKNYCR
jgi:hypothetical protein